MLLHDRPEHDLLMLRAKTEVSGEDEIGLLGHSIIPECTVTAHKHSISRHARLPFPPSHQAC